MMILLYIIFLVPIIFYFNLYLSQFSFVLLMIFYIFNYSFDFFCNLSYLFGYDYFSFWFVFLTMFFFCLIIISGNYFTPLYIRLFILTCYILFIFLFFVFSVMSMFFMYLFFEFSLIPLLMLIFGWGYQPERFIAGFYLLLYTLFASLPLLLVILYMYNLYGSFFYDFNYGFSLSFFFHYCLVFAFLVKFPMFMVHFWLPKAHVQASLPGSMILAGVLLSVGGYGIIRFMFLVDGHFYFYSYIWYSLCLWGSILISMICFCQSDIKCLIAYSSVSHMGMCLMGLLSMTFVGLTGSFILMIGHGLCSSGLFYLANVCYCRLGSRSFYVSKGMINIMPGMSFMWFIFSCVNMGCPPSLNFIGEVFIMISMLSYWSLSIIFLVLISFLVACFSYYLFGYIQHGLFHGCYSYMLGSVIEYLVLFIHMFPLFFLVLLLDLFI
uniref:NADH dehydrogenase subunit 4 n=1 Tax=Xestocephalus limpidissimus TaxID=3112140 RepID=UPI002E79BB35|nr:NADH dehydrogenase subunit 4 [Xestocephalus limpidissimus]WRK21331.1 NADH dehydrogenase subunit 4 [Xestocephalus limpidissimus]